MCFFKLCLGWAFLKISGWAGRGPADNISGMGYLVW